MWSLGHSRKSPSEGGAEDRSDQRMPAVGAFSCPLGEAVDVSVSGMQLKSNKKPPLKKGQSVEVTLRSGTSQLRVNGQLMWMRRVKREYRFGFKFVQVSESVQRALEALGRFGFIPSAAQLADAKKRKVEKERPKIKAQIRLSDHYHVLGVMSGATHKQIHEAYRLLTRKYHPDVSKEADAEARFKQVNQAYAVLKDPEQREAYDRARHQSMMSKAG